MPPNLLAHYLYLGKPQRYGKPLKQRGVLSRQADIRQVTGASSVTIKGDRTIAERPRRKKARGRLRKVLRQMRRIV